MDQSINVTDIDLTKFPEGSPVTFFLAVESEMDENTGFALTEGPRHEGIRRGSEIYTENEKGEGVYLIQEILEVMNDDGVVVKEKGEFFGLTSRFFNYV